MTIHIQFGSWLAPFFFTLICAVLTATLPMALEKSKEGQGILTAALSLPAGLLSLIAWIVWAASEAAK